MKCRQSEKIRLYRSCQLVESDKRLFERHLKTCPECAAELKMLHKVKETFTRKESRLPQIDVLDKVKVRLGLVSQTQPEQAYKRVASIKPLATKKGQKK